MNFMNEKTLDENNEELISVKAGNTKFHVYVGGSRVGGYETEEAAQDVKRVLDEALKSAYLSDIQYIK